MTKIVMTNSFRGGTGKSTIISNLASYMASFGLKVIIIDADVISPGVHAIFGLGKIKTTLTDFLNGTADIKDAVYDISASLKLPENTLMIVPSSMEKHEIANLIQQKKNSEKLIKGVEKLTDEFKPDFIMIDTHPGLNDEFLIMSNVTDVLLNVVRPDNQDYQGLEVSSDVAKKLKMKSYVVMNKVHKKLNKSKLQQTIVRSFDLPVAGMLPLSDDIILSQSQFVFTEKYPDHEFSKAIGQVAANAFGVKPKEHLEVMHDLLTDMDKGMDLMHILQKERINKVRGRNYINGLLEQGFVTKNKEDGYSITSKGVKFLNKYKKIRKFVDNFRL